MAELAERAGFRILLMPLYFNHLHSLFNTIIQCVIAFDFRLTSLG